MSIRLYVGNLPKEVDRKKLQDVFADAGDSVTTKVIKDRKGKCRGFGFVTVKTEEEADQIIEKYNGYMFEESELKIEKALPREKSEGKEGPSANAKGGKRNNKRGNKKPMNYTDRGSNTAQPDPRWASELEKLKEMLQKQTTNV